MASLPKVLLVEDDKIISNTLVVALSHEYEVDVVSTGKSGIYKSDYAKYDLIIMDLALPDISGIDTCIAFRQRDLRVPILILSGISDVKTKVSLLDSGANDYLTKPFALGELKARMRALIRRIEPVSESFNMTLEAFGVTLDRRTLSVKRNGIPIRLRRKEFELLACLMDKPGHVVSRSSLIERVWPGVEDVWTNTVDVHINHLREKLDKPYGSPLIHTVHGQGFKIEQIKVGFARA